MTYKEKSKINQRKVNSFQFRNADKYIILEYLNGERK